MSTERRRRCWLGVRSYRSVQLASRRSTEAGLRGDGTHRDGIGRRYTYVTKPELEGLLTDAGLTPLREWQGEEPGLDGVMAPWIIIQATKNA